MDTAIDFIRPEFFNILFFQQKNLVIFPYVDLKHLHGLDIFTIGHNTIDLESTALHNVREFLEGEAGNSYSQTPNLYFIYNVDKDNLSEIIGLENMRCIINTNENVRDLVNGSTYIFFNKKHNQFLNYNIPDSELAFEQYLISSSENEIILQDKIQQIKSMATKIFTELNKDSSLKRLPEILHEYDKKYWNAILRFTENYFRINIPDISQLSSFQLSKKKLKAFSSEYELIVTTNKQIGKEFIQLLHEYRSKRVNPSNLELEELFNPQKLYNYLRNHHWSEGIPYEFIDDWSKMEFSQYNLNEADQTDFEQILKELGIQYTFSPKLNSETIPIRNSIKEHIPETIPSPREEWNKYKQWSLGCMDSLDSLVDGYSGDKNDLVKEISELSNLLSVNFEPELTELPQENISNFLIVDLTNILMLDKDQQANVKVENIAKVREAVLSLGYTPHMIADANMQHHTNNEEWYKQLVDQGVVEQAPAGDEADYWVLRTASDQGCKFLTNDLYRDYRNAFGADWISQNRLTCHFFNGKFYIKEK